MSIRLLALLTLASTFAYTSCAATKQEQLESVARDWSLVVRASQVLPVYPLTADLQPGDVFLVQVPVDRQQEIYREKGYLPFDNHVARIDPAGYADFYDHSFVASATTPPKTPTLPAEWIQNAWATAPRAAFPSYAFSVRSGQGLSLALPVQGVPIGLGLLGSDAADGTISIGKARTLGVDIVSLDSQVRQWAEGHTSFLANFASTPQHSNYLRILTRIYLTGELDVSLRDASQSSIGLDAGKPRPVDLLLSDAPTSADGTVAVTTDEYTKNIAHVNEMLKAAMTTEGTSLVPGGSLRVTSASSRSIGLKETFDPPLVLGYLAFDVLIGADGELGPPIPTHAVLEGSVTPPSFEATTFRAHQVVVIGDVYDALIAVQDKDAVAKAKVAALDRLATLLPAEARTYSWMPTGQLVETIARANAAEQSHTFLDVQAYLLALEQSSADLALVLAKDTFVIKRAENMGTLTVTNGDGLWLMLKRALDAIPAELERIRGDAHFQAATRDALDHYTKLSKTH